ncbi:MAG: hypothetical protein EOL98_15970 [Negativicutes bacterium]|nr:hypothetical protein [Negativicutes bacterium]
MTTVTAIDKLKAVYGEVDIIRHDLFGVVINSRRVLYRLKKGILERRVDVSAHECRWLVCDEVIK